MVQNTSSTPYCFVFGGMRGGLRIAGLGRALCGLNARCFGIRIMTPYICSRLGTYECQTSTVTLTVK